MKTNLHLVFPGTCRQAFAFYEMVFGTKVGFQMTFGDAPAGSPVPENAKELIMHTSMTLGTILLQGCDAPGGREEAIGGFQIDLKVADVETVHQLHARLSDGGTITMPVAETFWSPCFGMVKDKFGVGWMVGVDVPS